MSKGLIFVTGGAGYIGSHVVYALEASGYDVVVYDNLSTGFRNLVSENATFIQGDILDFETLNQSIRDNQPKAVLHFAARSLVPESVQEPLSYFENNVVGTINLLKACDDNDVSKLVLSSTASVYGEPDQIPIPETADLKPVNPYGASKLMMEEIIQNTSTETEISHVILRYFNVAGADPAGRTGESLEKVSHLVYRAAKTALGEYPDIKIFGTDYPTPDGTCVRDYIHVSDLADAHVSALSYLLDGGKSTVLNCGYKKGFSVKEVLDCFNTVLDTPLKIEHAGRREGDPASLVADNTKLLDTLDWTPKYDNLDDIIQSAIAWEKKSTAILNQDKKIKHAG